MGGSAFSDDWEFIANGARTILLIGRTGDGRSATGNSILGRKAFRSMTSFGGVTRTCEIQRTRLEDGQILHVIETPGFDFTAESKLVGNEIVKCIDLADDGVHAVLFVLSVRTHFSRKEQAAIQYFSEFLGNKVSDYMIVVFTGGDELEDNDSLNDLLDRSCPEHLTEVLKMCGNRQVLFDNKTKDPMKKAEQLRELLFHVNKVVQNNGGKPYTDDLFEEGKANNGIAFLFARVRNIVVGTKEVKHLLTGLHTIADLYCENFDEEVGLKYERAVEPSQKYKEGKFLLEESKIVKGYW